MEARPARTARRRLLPLLQAAALVPVMLQLMLLLAAAGGAHAKPEDWAPAQTTAVEHWAYAGCTELTGKGMKFALHNRQCHMCVDDTKDVGDPSNCHRCMKHHGGQSPAELIDTCMECVPAMEPKKLGWACAQYCSHHTIINNRQQAMDCMQCLANDLPKDKWYCHVCMEHVDKDMVARDDCYSCLSTGKDGYECAACGRVIHKDERARCYKCMEEGKSGFDCMKETGVSGVNPQGKATKSKAEMLVMKRQQDNKDTE